jgi:hypothetical protein
VGRKSRRRRLQCVSVALLMTVGVIGTTAASASTPPSWSVVNSPKPLHAAFARNAFSSVACIGKSSCFGVGYYVDTSNVQHALIEHWKGAHWRVVTSPNAPGVSLNGVTCTSVSDCFAVGVQNGRGRDRALIERWDGTRWKLAAGANPAGVSASLSGVTCVSADNCFAVGRIETGMPSALAEHWNGAKWSLVPVPMDGGTEPQMLSVACASATNCFAVGNAEYGRDDFAFVEQWNGSNWAIANSPRASNVTASLLSGVTCSGANNCFAVGRRFTGGSARTMIERWNGAEWTIVASPDPYNAVLLGVTHAWSHVRGQLGWDTLERCRQSEPQ